MPKGNATPRDLMLSRYTLLETKLSKMDKDYSLETKVRRKVRSLLGLPNNRVTSRKVYDMEKLHEKMSRQLSSQARRNPDRKTLMP